MASVSRATGGARRRRARGGDHGGDVGGTVGGPPAQPGPGLDPHEAHAVEVGRAQVGHGEQEDALVGGELGRSVAGDAEGADGALVDHEGQRGGGVGPVGLAEQVGVAAVELLEVVEPDRDPTGGGIGERRPVVEPEGEIAAAQLVAHAHRADDLQRAVGADEAGHGGLDGQRGEGLADQDLEGLGDRRGLVEGPAGQPEAGQGLGGCPFAGRCGPSGVAARLDRGAHVVGGNRFPGSSRSAGLRIHGPHCRRCGWMARPGPAGDCCSQTEPRDLPWRPTGKELADRSPPAIPDRAGEDSCVRGC